MSKIGSAIWNMKFANTSHACYICGSHIGTSKHHITPQANGGKDDRRNIMYLCDIHHNEFEGASWNILHKARRTFVKDQFKQEGRFRTPEGHDVEWSKQHQEFREWVCIPGGIMSFPYTGPIPKIET